MKISIVTKNSLKADQNIDQCYFVVQMSRFCKLLLTFTANFYKKIISICLQNVTKAKLASLAYRYFKIILKSKKIKILKI